MRVAIVGSREWAHPDAVIRCVNALPEGTVVVSGGARGVDTVAVAAAVQRGLETQVWLPDYDTYGDVAPMVRNREIVDDCDQMFAFRLKRSSGTSNAIRLARKSGKPVKVMDL